MSGGGSTRQGLTKHEWRRLQMKAPEIRGDITSDDDDGDDALGAQRTATFVVAASDSNQPDLDVADYVCDGTADQVTIQEAIDALPPATTSPYTYNAGRVLLMEGSYNLSGSILLRDSVTFQGQGNSTVLRATSAAIKMIDYATASEYWIGIRDLFLDGADLASYGIYSGGANAVTISGVHVEQTNIYGIRAQGRGTGPTKIVNCDLVNNNGTAINTLGGESVLVKGCYIASNTLGAFYSSGTGGEYLRFIGNFVYANGSLSGSDGVISAYGGKAKIADNVIVSNTGGPAIYVGGSNKAESITGNFIFDNNHEGIATFNCVDAHISDNTLHSNGSAAASTYPQISLQGGTDYAHVADNTIRKGSNGNKASYGIAVLAASCDGNFIEFNDLYTSGQTGDISDSGTGTVQQGNRLTTGFEGVTPKAHNILSVSHGDTFAADTPADTEVLTWVAANSRWESKAAAGGGDGGAFAFFMG